MAEREEGEEGELVGQVSGDELSVGIRLGQLGTPGFVEAGSGGVKVGLFEVEEVDFQADASVSTPDDEGGIVLLAQGFGRFSIRGGDGRF